MTKQEKKISDLEKRVAELEAAQFQKYQFPVVVYPYFYPHYPRPNWLEVTCNENGNGLVGPGFNVTV